MELGDPQPAITIEPIVKPVPNPEPAPQEPHPVAPKREKEKLPA